MTKEEFANCIGLLRFGEMAESDDVAETTEYIFTQIVEFGSTGYEIPSGSPLDDFFSVVMQEKEVLFDPTEIMHEMLIILTKEDSVILEEVKKRLQENET